MFSVLVRYMHQEIRYRSGAATTYMVLQQRSCNKIKGGRVLYNSWKIAVSTETPNCVTKQPRGARSGSSYHNYNNIYYSHYIRTLMRSNAEPAAREYASRHGRCEQPQAGAACSDSRGTQRSRGCTPRDQACGWTLPLCASKVADKRVGLG